MKLNHSNVSISPKNNHSPKAILYKDSIPRQFKDATKLISPQIELHLSPEYLIPQGDPLKELGFGTENKENYFNQLSVKIYHFKNKP
jgi:hypothetical protein